MSKSIYFCIILVILVFKKVTSQDFLGVLHAYVKDGTNSTDQCIHYTPDFHQLALTPDEAKEMLLYDYEDSVMCEEPPKPPPINGSAVAIARGNCTFSEKALLVQMYGGEAVLVVSKTGLVSPAANTSSDYGKINISVAVISQQSFDQVKGIGKQVYVKLFAPEPQRIDYNMILMLAMAVGTVTIGAYWSGIRKYQCITQRKRSRKRRGEGEENREEDEDEEDDSIDINPAAIIGFVILMCGVLVALYFLYDYLVYLIIAMFVLASSIGLYECIKPFLHRITCIGNCRIPANRLPVLKQRPEVRDIILGLLCFGVGIFWMVIRHKDYAWVLQNILGITFCINMMKTVRLPNFKICCILLLLLFIYDVFFVFITPLFTKHGDSIMVEVATGGSSGSGEQLPMVLKVPRFGHSLLSVCPLPYSLLGFGDILVPGLLVSYNHGFDMQVHSKKVYYIASLVAYTLGLVLCFVALYFMQSGQPALFYIVPLTLLATILVALIRGELKLIWNGHIVKKKSESPSTDQHGDPTVVQGNDSRAVPRASHARSNSLDSNSSGGSEDRLLIQNK